MVRVWVRVRVSATVRGSVRFRAGARVRVRVRVRSKTSSVITKSTIPIQSPSYVRENTTMHVRGLSPYLHRSIFPKKSRRLHENRPFGDYRTLLGLFYRIYVGPECSSYGGCTSGTKSEHVS